MDEQTVNAIRKAIASELCVEIIFDALESIRLDPNLTPEIAIINAYDDWEK